MLVATTVIMDTVVCDKLQFFMQHFEPRFKKNHVDIYPMFLTLKQITITLPGLLSDSNNIHKITL
jgi:hypothetical protein